MKPLFPLAPRYRLDDELPWLEGIDPSRHYWLRVNGCSEVSTAIPGLVVASQAEFKQAILQFRALQPGEQMILERVAQATKVYCVSTNCFALEDQIEGAIVWHLFDQETLESLLMTSHPDWQCAPKDIDLGRRLLMRSWQHSVAA